MSSAETNEHSALLASPVADGDQDARDGQNDRRDTEEIIEPSNQQLVLVLGSIWVS